MNNTTGSNHLIDRSAARRFGDNKRKFIKRLILQRGVFLSSLVLISRSINVLVVTKLVAVVLATPGSLFYLLLETAISYPLPYFYSKPSSKAGNTFIESSAVRESALNELMIVRN